MKKLITLLMLISTYCISQTNDQSYEELVKESPFNEMYPEFMAHEAAEYFKVFNKLFSDESPIEVKEARLIAVSVSAAIRCEYCVSAQVHLQKSGATDDEIKAAIQMLKYKDFLLFFMEMNLELIN